MNSLVFVCGVVLGFGLSDSANCPSGWLVHGQTCYHFSHDKEVWGVARVMCKILGGDLAAILTNDVDRFLKNEMNRLSGNFWIGGNDLEEEGLWVWVSNQGSFSEYSHWNPNEPSNSGNNENCLEVGSGSEGWNDIDCTSVFKYICEKPGAEPGVIG